MGNPLISRINYLEPCGLQDNKNTPELVLTWNAMPNGNPIVRRTFWVYNSSPFNMVVDWQLFKEGEVKKEEEIIEGKQTINVEGQIEEKIEEAVVEEIVNGGGRGGGGGERGEDGKGREEAPIIVEEPKLPNMFRIIFNIEENKENTLHCMLIPERNGEEWCIRVCIIFKLYLI